MTQQETNKQQKIVVRTVFQGIEADGLLDLMKRHSIVKPQDMVKFFVSNEIKKIKEIEMRYGKKGSASPGSRETEDGPELKTPTLEEHAESILKSGDYVAIINLLLEVGYIDKLDTVYCMSGVEFGQTLTEEEKSIMPPGYQSWTYIYRRTNGGMKYTEPINNEYIAEVKKFIKSSKR